MGIFDKFKNLVNPDEEDMDDGSYMIDDSDASSYTGEEDYYQAQPQPQAQTQYQTQGGVQYQQPAQNVRMSQGGMSINGNALELKVIRPEHWENVNQIADHLINRRTVVLNLEATNKETARRMIDFLLGVVYTIEGDIKKVAANTWVITPSNVDMSQEQQAASRQNTSYNL